MTTAVLYLRQSQDDPTNRSASIPDQESQCRSLAAVQACDDVVIFADGGRSGKDRNRPGFRDMLDRIDAGSVAVVAFLDASRIARRASIAIDFYERVVEDHPEIQVVSVMGGKVENTPNGRLMWLIEAGVSEHYQATATAKIKLAYHNRMQDGRMVGPVPYGYCSRFELDANGNKLGGRIIEVDPVRGPIVEWLFQQYADGEHTTKTLAVALSERKAPIPGKRDRWMPDTVAQILANTAYVAKTYTESRQRRKGDLIDAKWSPIVSDPLFQRAQARLKSFRVPITKGGSHQREFTFRGLLWCGECGERMWSQQTAGRAYIYCGSRRHGSDCSQATHGIRESALTPWFDRIVDGLDKWNVTGEHLLEHRQRERETSADAIGKIDRRIKRLGDRYEAEEIGSDEYRAKLAEYRRQRAAYEAKASDTPVVEPNNLVSMWRSGDAAMRRSALVALFERLTVRGGRIVTYTPRADRANRVALLVQTALDVMDDDEEAQDDDSASSSEVVECSGSESLSLRQPK
jgi:DNA invertase Pin-like site-specific DNA recombinase